MKVFVIFDEQGRIRGSVGSELENIAIRSGSEMRVHAIEVSDVGRERAPEYLRDLHTNYRVSLLGETKLVRRRR